MTEDDAAARKARAERLRKQIAQLIGEDKPEEIPEDPPATASEAERGGDTSQSPRDFIHRRMRQLNKGKKRGK